MSGRFQDVQHAFVAHMRDPQACPPPADIEDRRLKIYRELIFNNIESFLKQAFPVLSKILVGERWQQLVRRFIAEHRCQSPYFVDIPEEFLDYLNTGSGVGETFPPFTTELAHYEWVELALEVSQQELPLTQVDGDGDLLAGKPVLSPLLYCLSYAWPVHEISVDFQPQVRSAQPHWLLVYRDRRDVIGFMEINAVTARLLELMEASAGKTGRELLSELAVEIGHDPNAFVSFGADLLTQLRERDIVLGVLR